ncbi:MAG: efflux RND transporter periplasmic adaptor subunit [Acidobacteria bacterium]|nr:MAG: efflux RND transporter periplasmic adaptor subunit [Acidobacteriota bacterium]
MKKRLAIIWSVATIMTVTGCGGTERGDRAAEAHSTVTARLKEIAPVTVKETYQAVGTVRSKTISTLSSKLMGYVTAVYVKEGDRVRAGQLLIQLDDRDVRAQLRKAQAGLMEAKQALQEVERAIAAAEQARVAAEANRRFASATYKRYQALLERRSVSRQEFDEVEAKYRSAVAEANRATEMLRSLQAKKRQVLARIDQATAEVTNAQTMVSYSKITSPITGVVTMKNVDVGVLASPGVPLLTVEDHRAYRLDVLVEESQLDRIHLGDEAAVTIAALDDGRLKGVVREIVPAADPASRSFIVKLDLPSHPGLRSGLFGKAQFTIGEKKAILLPSSAVIERGQLTAVYVVDDTHRARLRLVKTGKRYGDSVEILSGLHRGDRVIIEGVERVKEGNIIRES